MFIKNQTPTQDSFGLYLKNIGNLNVGFNVSPTNGFGLDLMGPNSKWVTGISVAFPDYDSGLQEKLSFVVKNKP